MGATGIHTWNTRHGIRMVLLPTWCIVTMAAPPPPPPCDDQPSHLGPLGSRTDVHPGCCEPRSQCQKYHVGGHTVCDHCRVHTRHMLCLIRTRFTMNINYDFLLPVGVAHPQPGASPPTLNGWQSTAEAGTGVVFAGQGPIGRRNPPWDGFLTRLCYDCELLVSSEIMHRSPTPHGPLFGGGVGTIPALKAGTKQEEREWLWYPEVSCTCKWRLGITPLPDRQTLCYEHTKTELEKLVKTKNRNDEWLRNIERVPGKAGLRDATVATKRARVISGSWRACRV